MVEDEIWKDIPGYEGYYQASTLGRVKSLPRRGRKEEWIITCKPGVRGYMTIGLLKKNQKRKTIRIHQLVAMTFLDHSPDGMKLVVDHKDNNTLNNRLDNLQIISQRENNTKDKNKINRTSQYIGVYWDKVRNNYQSRIKMNGKSIHLGVFSNEIDASNAYQDKLKEINKI